MVIFLWSLRATFVVRYIHIDSKNARYVQAMNAIKKAKNVGSVRMATVRNKKCCACREEVGNHNCEIVIIREVGDLGLEILNCNLCAVCATSVWRDIEYAKSKKKQNPIHHR